MVGRRVAVLVAVVGGSVAVIASGGTTSSGGSSPEEGGSTHPASADVKIAKCALPNNQFEGAQATLKVTNHSSKASDYIITIAFDSPNGKTQFDTGDAIINNLGPGQTTTNTDATSLKSSLRKKKFVCKVASVTRTASN